MTLPGKFPTEILLNLAQPARCLDALSDASVAFGNRDIAAILVFSLQLIWCSAPFGTKCHTLASRFKCFQVSNPPPDGRGNRAKHALLLSGLRNPAEFSESVPGMPRAKTPPHFPLGRCGQNDRCRSSALFEEAKISACAPPPVGHQYVEPSGCPSGHRAAGGASPRDRFSLTDPPPARSLLS